MLILFILIVSLLGYINLKVSKSIIHPVFITCLLWIILVTLYYFIAVLGRIYKPLSPKFYICILFFIIPFFLTVEFFTKDSRIDNLVVNNSFVERNKLKFNLMYIFVMGYAIYYIISIFRYTHTTNIPSIIMIIRRDNLLNTTPFNVKLGSYSYTFSYVFMLYCLLFKKIKEIKWRFIVLLFTVLFTTVLSASKSAVIQVFVCVLFAFILRRKLKFRSLLALFVIVMAFLYYVTINRDKAFLIGQNALLKYTYIYFLSPLPALDYLLSEYRMPVDSNAHLAIFAFIFRVVDRLNLNIHMPKFKGIEEVYVPYQTNVFTLAGSIYVNYRFFGIFVFGILYGVIYGILYEKGVKRNNKYCKMLYILFVFDLIMQFFGETLISFLSLTLQRMFISFLLTKKVILHSKNE
jgi:oligosaccharide repeat unit polymerase